jgi:DNA-binding NarL/FixJ family response regulator
MTMIRVFHCDDSEAFTRLVELWLGDHEDIEHAGAANSVEATLAALPAVDPDVILLDTMGEPSSEGLLRSIRERAPGARVIVFSAYVDLPGQEIVGPGADGYAAKGDDETALVAVIRRVVG